MTPHRTRIALIGKRQPGTKKSRPHLEGLAKTREERKARIRQLLRIPPLNFSVVAQVDIFSLL